MSGTSLRVWVTINCIAVYVVESPTRGVWTGAHVTCKRPMRPLPLPSGGVEAGLFGHGPGTRLERRSDRTRSFTLIVLRRRRPPHRNPDLYYFDHDNPAVRRITKSNPPMYLSICGCQ